jgi:hypothetical protein
MYKFYILNCLSDLCEIQVERAFHTRKRLFPLLAILTCYKSFFT